MPSYTLQELYHDLEEGVPSFAADEINNATLIKDATPAEIREAVDAAAPNEHIISQNQSVIEFSAADALTFDTAKVDWEHYGDVRIGGDFPLITLGSGTSVTRGGRIRIYGEVNGQGKGTGNGIGVKHVAARNWQVRATVFNNLETAYLVDLNDTDTVQGGVTVELKVINNAINGWRVKPQPTGTYYQGCTVRAHDVVKADNPILMEAGSSNAFHGGGVHSAGTADDVDDTASNGDNLFICHYVENQLNIHAKSVELSREKFQHARALMDDGGPSNPSFSFKDEEATGFYRPASGQVGVAGNGSEILKFAGSGLIAPTTGMTVGVAGTGGTDFMLKDDGSARVFPGGAAQPGSNTDPALELGTNGAGFFVNSSGELVAVDEAGNTTTIS